MEHQPPPFFKTGPTALVRLLIFSLLSLTLLVADARFKYLATLRQIAAAIVYPLERLANAPVNAAARVADFFVTQAALKAENARLKERELASATALQQFRSLSSENAQLRELLAVRERLPGQATAAEVLYAARDPFSRKVIIDKGLQEGIRPGQPVVDNIGVIGQVTRVHLWTSEVTLITDKDQAVPVQNLRSGLRGVVFGVGHDGMLDLRFMPVNADIRTGDRLVTSGIDGTYPPGLPVAEVVNIERNAADMFARIAGKPVAGVASHLHVLVLNWERKAPERPPAAEHAPAKRKKPKKGG
ncbi:MAG: rod shape-determining protein MreC [Betaproteobacteria bacterium]|nr:rod shape-determining protein MreC [Betaproteobacteria bacterium]